MFGAILFAEIVLITIVQAAIAVWFCRSIVRHFKRISASREAGRSTLLSNVFDDVFRDRFFEIDTQKRIAH